MRRPRISSIQTDPLTANAYAFVNGDPVNPFDPTGYRVACDGGGNCGNDYDKSNGGCGPSKCPVPEREDYGPRSSA